MTDSNKIFVRLRSVAAVMIALLLVLSLGLALVACGGGNDPCTEHVDADSNGKCDKCDAAVEPDDGGDEGNGGAATGAIELIKGGAVNFQIVSTEETATALGKNLTNFVKTLNDCLEDGEVKAVYEHVEAKDIEIIIGAVSTRGNEFTADSLDATAYGYEGWSVQLIGNKIVVIGGSSGAYKSALAYLEESIFGITDTTEYITDVSMTAELAKTERQTEFDLTLTIDGNALSEYVFAIDPGNEAAQNVVNGSVNLIYRKTGVYLKTVDIDEVADGQKAIYIEKVEPGATEDGFIIYVEDGNLHITSEFINKLEEEGEKYLVDEVAGTKKSTLNIANGTVKTLDVRNIYYADFGATGNGITDDFESIQDCHTYANKYGHTVNADKNATYYIGGTHGSEFIKVQTDTNWNGCKFIFDDSGIAPTDSARIAPVFYVQSDYSTVTYSGSTLPFTSLASGATNLGGWAPGFSALIIVYNDNVKHFIRYGANQNEGEAQKEILRVDANGNIDASTPVQWDYETVTKVVVHHADDKPITVSGGTETNKALVETIFNGAQSAYTYYNRNIYITRSNTILENVEHIITGEIPESEGGTGAPYNGFTKIEYCSDVTVRGMIYQKPIDHHVYNDPGNRMGSYEMWASHANNVLWYGCVQSNFYNKDGSVTFGGMMNSNFCKNITLDNMLTCSFDAHQGVYNATIKNSTVEHMNFIGDGLITVENVKVYVDGSQHASMNLRQDYGSTWWGDVKIDGLTLMYSDDTPDYEDIAVMKVYWDNWNFGYTTSLPQNMWIKDVIIQHFSYSVDANGVRDEKVLATNDRPVSLFSKTVAQNANDLSNPNAIIDNVNPNINPTEGTKTVTLINKDPKNPIDIIWPISKQFKDLDVTVDGVLIIEDGVKVKK